MVIKFLRILILVLYICSVYQAALADTPMQPNAIPVQSVPTITDKQPPISPEIKDNPNYTIYSAKDILTKAEDTQKSFDRVFNGTIVTLGFLFAILAFLLPYWHIKQKELQGELSLLQSKHDILSNTIAPILSAVGKQATRVTEVSARLQLGTIAFMDSDSERAIMAEWIKRTDYEIGIHNIEHMINSSDPIHTFSSDVYRNLGHYYRYQSTSLKCKDHSREYMCTANSYYKRALTQNPGSATKIAELHGCIAICQHILGNSRECLDQVGIAIHLRACAGYPPHSLLRELKGYALMTLRDFAGAEKEYNNALTLSESRFRVFYNVACNNSLWGDQLRDGGYQEAGDARYQAALEWLVRIPPKFKSIDTTMQERACTDSDLAGLREHPSFGEKFNEWTTLDRRT